MPEAFANKSMLLIATASGWLDIGYDVGLLLLGVLIGLIVEWLRSRTKLIHDVAERYIEDRCSSVQDESYNRLGSMQRAGVGLFKNDSQITEFCRIVVGRGCTHPFLGSDLDFYIKKNGLIPFLNEASRRGVALSDDMALYEMLVQGLIEAEDNQRKAT